MINPQQNFIHMAGENMKLSRHKRIQDVLGNNIISSESATHQFENVDVAKRRASLLKWKTHAKLDDYLLEFEANFIKAGGKVIWAVNADEAMATIISILKKADVDLVVKSKSVASDEINLKESLRSAKVECVETDLGDYIQQLSNEPAFHMIMPALHKSFAEVKEIFSEDFPTANTENPEAIVALVRNVMKNKFISANAGITGANFLAADTGSVCITENEGNAILTASYPKIHIVVAGIEKVIPSLNDLHLFLPLLSSHGTNQNLTSLNHILTGPKKAAEVDGPEEMYVILLDNGRTNVLESAEQRQALSCIRCGACLNVCPVYKFSGGHAYGPEAMGPIGSVLMPHKYGLKEYKHLSYASTLCGKCTDVCPVKIDLHKLLLYSRKDAVSAGMVSRYEKLIFFFWKKSMLSRVKMNRKISIKKFFLDKLFKKNWGPERELPEFAPLSFNEAWRNRFPELDK